MASSAQLRRSFEEMPPGYCKDFVRGRADNLLREGHSMVDAMAKALAESLTYFPEVWVLMRGLQDRNWSPNDIQIALQSAAEAMDLRREAIDWRQAKAEERGEIVKGKGKGKGQDGTLQCSQCGRRASQEWANTTESSCYYMGLWVCCVQCRRDA